MIGSDFISWLENKGFGTFGTNIFLNFQPVLPDNCITVYDVDVSILEESSSLSVDQLGIQIIVRNTNSQNAQTIIENIHKQFMGYGPGVLKAGSNNRVSMNFCDSIPQSIGKDDKGCQEFSATYRMRVQTENNSYRL
jgi:hypothetical protein